MVLDEKDSKIVEVLKEHAEYTTRQISRKILLPATTIHTRIKRLKKEKIIKKFTVELDYKKIGLGFAAYILISVNLRYLKKIKKSQHDIAKELRRFYFIEKADIVSGGTDIVAFVRVKDVEEFDQALFKKIQLIEGVEKTQSLIVING